MEPPDPSFADEFNVPQEYAVLVFEVHRAPVSLPFQVHRLKVLVGSRPGRLLEGMFRVCERSPKISSARQPCAPSESFFQPSSRPFEGCCREVLPSIGAVDMSDTESIGGIVCTTYVCVWPSHIARVRINRVRLSILLVVS